MQRRSRMRVVTRLRDADRLLRSATTFTRMRAGERRIPRRRFTLRRRHPTSKTPLFRIDPFNLARPSSSFTALGLNCASGKVFPLPFFAPFRGFFVISFRFHERTFS